MPLFSNLAMKVLNKGPALKPEWVFSDLTMEAELGQDAGNKKQPPPRTPTPTTGPGEMSQISGHL